MVQLSHLLLLGMCLPHLGFLTAQGQTSALTGLVLLDFFRQTRKVIITKSWSLPMFAPNKREWLAGAKVLGRPPVSGRSVSRARAYCAFSNCRWGCFPLSFLSSFSLCLGDGPIETEILPQKAAKPREKKGKNNQPS